MTCDDFLLWLDNARPGDRCIYYEGYLGEHKYSELQKAVLKAAGYDWCVGSDGLGRWERVNSPRVLLTQRRTGKNCAYIATRVFPGPQSVTEGYSLPAGWQTSATRLMRTV